MNLSVLTGRGVRVAVIDSGWNRRGFSSAQVLRGFGLVDPVDALALLPSRDDHDSNGHGTSCIRTILEVAPDAEIVPIRVFGRHLEASPAQLDAALRISAECGADVTSMSLAATAPDVRDLLRDATERAARSGTLLVAAASNRGDPAYPASFPHVLGVRAAKADDPLSFTFDAGSAIECAISGAPPVDPPGRPRWGLPRVGSSSFATARMAGILALIREAEPDADATAARTWLLRLAQKGTVAIS